MPTRLRNGGSVFSRWSKGFADAGGTIVMEDDAELYRRGAYLWTGYCEARNQAIADRAGDRFELVINMKIAKALGINIPQAVMLRADRMIE